MKYINLKLLSVLIISLFLSQSCSKQQAPSIDDSILGGHEEVGRVEACTRVNFNNDVLLHENSIDLFRCTGWDKEFPAMFEALVEVESGYWDHIFSPLDKEFISNHSRRNRFFSSIKRLDRTGGLDDLSKVINALNETNFFDSLNLMFACIDMPEDKKCFERRGRIPDKEKLKDVFKLLNVDAQVASLISKVLKDLSNSSKDNEQLLRNEVSLFKEDHTFTKARVRLVDALAEKTVDGVTPTDSKFVTGLFGTLEKSNGIPWVYNWLQDSKMNQVLFSKFLEYPQLVNPLLIQQINALKSFYDKSFMCTIRDGHKVNDLIDFDFKTYVGNFVEILKEDSYKRFYDFSASTIVGFKLADEICQELSKNEFDVDFSQALEEMARFLSEKKYYDLIRFVFNITPVGKDPNKNFNENQYFLDLMTGNLFESFNEANGAILRKTEAFYPEIFKVFKKISSESYEDVSVIAGELMDENHNRGRKGLADFWSFFSLAEKNFLFNFVDRHFDKKTKTTELFLFYADLLDEFEEVAPHVRKSFVGNEESLEMTYLSIERLAQHLEGRAVLSDFKRFFSRDHILLLLQTISNGAEINKEAIAELKYRTSNEYLIKSKHQKHYFEISQSGEQYEAGELLRCMAIFNNSQMSFYYLIKSFPQECVSVSESNISFKLFSWLTAIEQTYKEIFNKEASSLLDDQGIMSPMMLNSNIALVKELDLTMGDFESKLPAKSGIEYILNNLKIHFFDYSLADLIPSILKEANSAWSLLGDDGVIYRSSVLKQYTTEETFAKGNSFFWDTARLAGAYGSWLQEDKLRKYNEKRVVRTEYRDEFSCGKVMNTFINVNACPDKEKVKKSLSVILKYLTVKYEKNTNTGIHYLIESTKEGGGIQIPLNNKKQKLYRLTLGETFNYLYDTTDRSLPVNQIIGSYVNEKWVNKKLPMTTLERVEIVIRDVKFKNNYLGAGFLNGIVEASDYDEEVEYRRRLMSKCLKIPKVRCMRAMSDDELRQAQNALRHFNSLLDVNNGRGLNKDFKYGNYLKTFEQILVMSSAKVAQESKLTPHKDEVLLKHNGRLLGEMTLINLWSNSARIIRDRIGRSREDFEEFVKTDVKRVDDAFLRGFDVADSGAAAERLINKMLEVQGSGRTILDQTIDWASSLTYEESRVAEEVLGRFALMSTYLGKPSDVFNNNFEDADVKYKDFDKNNMYQVFLAAEKMIDHYEKIVLSFPTKYRLYDALVPLNNLLIFFNEQLKSSDSPNENVAYRVLNNSFLLIDYLFFSKQLDPRFDRKSKEVSGINLAYDYLGKSKDIISVYYLINKTNSYLGKWHLSKGKTFLEFEQNLARIIENKKISFTHLRDYLNFTTKNMICLVGSEDCTANTHFDEPVKISKYLLERADGKSTYFEKATNAVFVENFDQLNGIINDMLPAIVVKPHQSFLEVY